MLLKFEHFRNLPGKQSVHLNPSLTHLQPIHLLLALHQQQLGIMYIEKLEEVEIKIADYAIFISGSVQCVTCS